MPRESTKVLAVAQKALQSASRAPTSPYTPLNGQPNTYGTISGSTQDAVARYKAGTAAAATSPKKLTAPPPSPAIRPVAIPQPSRQMAEINPSREWGEDYWRYEQTVWNISGNLPPYKIPPRR